MIGEADKLSTAAHKRKVPCGVSETPELRMGGGKSKGASQQPQDNKGTDSGLGTGKPLSKDVVKVVATCGI